VDARAATDVCGSSVRRSRVVLTPRCWRQAGGKCPAGDGGKRAVRRGELEVSRKAIAQGRPECSRCPVCSCAFLFAQIARETAGAASTRSSLRPLFSRRATKMQTSGAMRREITNTYSVVITRLVRNCALGRVTQYSRGSSDRADKPRRTGSPAFAGDDELIQSLAVTPSR